MNRFSVISPLLLLGGLLVSPLVSEGATYYVAKDGSNAHTCKQAQSATTPKLTIRAGAACLSGGDTLDIRSGTYSEDLADNIFPSGLSSSARTTIRSHEGETVTIQRATPHSLLLFSQATHIQLIGGSGYPFKFVGGAKIEAGANNAGAVISFTNDDVVIDGIDVTNPESGSLGGHHCILGGGGITIRNSHIHSCRAANYTNGNNGLYLVGNNVTVENNLIEDVSHNAVRCGAGDQPSDNCVIRGNTMIKTGTGAMQYARAVGMKIYNNVIISPTFAGIQLLNSGGDISIWNNTIVGAQYCIYSGGGSVLVAKNNICANNKIDGITFENTRSVTASNNLCTTSGSGTGCDIVKANPGFVSAGANDYHLTSAHNLGANLSSSFTTDKDGVCRPGGGPPCSTTGAWDIGAYQYVAAPLAPTNLRRVTGP